MERDRRLAACRTWPHSSERVALTGRCYSTLLRQDASLACRFCLGCFRAGASPYSGRMDGVSGAPPPCRFILIAVGAVPMRLGIPGEEHLITSTEFLELDQLPKKIVLLGGGFIAAEFADIAAQAGAQVTVIEQMDRMLTPFDPDLVGWLMEKFNGLVHCASGGRVDLWLQGDRGRKQRPDSRRPSCRAACGRGHQLYSRWPSGTG